MSLHNLGLATPADSEQFFNSLLSNISNAVHWAYLRHQRHIRRDEIDDLTQQIILMLIEDDCRRLRSFRCQSSFKTWLQAVVNNCVYKWCQRRKQTENLNEINHGSLLYSPPQDQEIAITEKRNLLLRAVGRLNEQERTLYYLCFEFEIEADKIANIFETDVKIIYKRKQTLILKLKRLVHSLQSH